MHELNREGSIFGQFPLFSAALQRCQQSHSFESTGTGWGKPGKGAGCENTAASSDPKVASSSIDPSSHSARSHGAQEVHPFGKCGTPETALPVRDQRVPCRVEGGRTTSTSRSFPGRSEDCCPRIAPTPDTADHAQPRKRCDAANQELQQANLGGDVPQLSSGTPSKGNSGGAAPSTPSGCDEELLWRHDHRVRQAQGSILHGSHGGLPVQPGYARSGEREPRLEAAIRSMAQAPTAVPGEAKGGSSAETAELKEMMKHMMFKMHTMEADLKEAKEAATSSKTRKTRTANTSRRWNPWESKSLRPHQRVSRGRARIYLQRARVSSARSPFQRLGKAGSNSLGGHTSNRPWPYVFDGSSMRS